MASPRGIRGPKKAFTRTTQTSGSVLRLLELDKGNDLKVSIPEIKKQSSKGRYLTYAKYIVDVQCGRLRWNLSKRTADFVEFSAACVRAAGPHMQLRLPAVSRLGMSNSDRKTRARLYEELINKAKLESRLKPLLIKFLHFVVTADSTFKSRASKARHASSQGALQFQRTLLVQSALQSIFRLSDVIQLILSYDASGDLALRGHRGKVFGVSCSPDCNLVATSGADLCIRVWSRWSGALLATLNTAISTQTGSGRTSRLVFSVCFSSDGLGLAAGTGEGWVLVFSRSGASTGEKWALNTIIKPHSGPIFRIVRSPNGDIFASCSDDSTVALWEIGRHQKPIKLQSRFAEAVYDIAFSADGRVLAATGRDRIIQTWSVSRSRTSQSLTAQHGPQGDIVKAVPARIINVKNAVIRSLSYSPDGAFLAAGAYGSEDQATTQKRLILIYDAKSLRLKTKLYAHVGPIMSLSFSPDSSMLLSTSVDGTARLWTVPRWKQTLTNRYKEVVFDSEFSQDGTALMVSVGDGCAYVVAL